MKITEKLRDLALHSKLTQTIIKGEDIVIDNSSFEVLTQCDVKGFIEVVLKKKAARNTAALVFGGAFHKAMETFYKGNSEEASIQAALTEAEEKDLNGLEDAKRNTGSLQELLRFYFMDYKLGREKFNVVKLASPESEAFVEKSFAFPLGEIEVSSGTVKKVIKIIWSGRIDLAVERPEGIYTVDHKTTSIMGPQFADDKLRSSQMLGYAWATTKFLEASGDSRAFRGILINAVCMRSKGFERQVYTLPYAKWQLDQWQLETLVILQTTLTRLLHTTSNSFLCPCRTSCVTKYGKCSHFETCQLGSEAMERLLLDEAFYKNDDWNPLNED